MRADFYDDQRFCARCRTYVPYLESPRGAYCARCGDRVTLFSEADGARFQASLRSMRRDFELSTGDDREAG